MVSTRIRKRQPKNKSTSDWVGTLLVRKFWQIKLTADKQPTSLDTEMHFRWRTSRWDNLLWLWVVLLDKGRMQISSTSTKMLDFYKWWRPMLWTRLRRLRRKRWLIKVLILEYTAQSLTEKIFKKYGSFQSRSVETKGLWQNLKIPHFHCMDQ